MSVLNHSFPDESPQSFCARAGGHCDNLCFIVVAMIHAIGQYALINLRCYPVEQVMLGIEYPYRRRYNFSDGFFSRAYKIQ